MTWKEELPNYADLSDADAAAAISALTNPPTPRMVFGSFRTLGAFLTEVEYNTLKAALTSAAAHEEEQGGARLNDMLKYMSIPGDESGAGGGLDLGAADVVGMLQHFAAVVPDEVLAEVPAKVAAYVASQQPAPSRKYPEVHAGDVAKARREMQR